jgi:hypothetical protein
MADATKDSQILQLSARLEESRLTVELLNKAFADGVRERDALRDKLVALDAKIASINTADIDEDFLRRAIQFSPLLPPPGDDVVQRIGAKCMAEMRRANGLDHAICDAREMLLAAGVSEDIVDRCFGGGAA